VHPLHVPNNKCEDHSVQLSSFCLPCQLFLCTDCEHPIDHARFTLDQVTAHFHRYGTVVLIAQPNDVCAFCCRYHEASTVVLQKRLVNIDVLLAQLQALHREICDRLRTTPLEITAFFKDAMADRCSRFVAKATRDLNAALKTAELQQDAVTMLRDGYHTAIHQGEITAAQPQAHLHSTIAVAARLHQQASTTVPLLAHMVQRLPVFATAKMDGHLLSMPIIFSDHQ
jgi:hypothetical protein